MVSRLYISWFTCYRFSSIFSWKCNGSGNRYRDSACFVLWSSWHSLCFLQRWDNFSLRGWRQNSSCLFGQVVEYIFFKDSVILPCPNNFTQFNLKSTKQAVTLQFYTNIKILYCELQLKTIPISDPTNVRFSFPFYNLLGIQHSSNHLKVPLGIWLHTSRRNY